jgi:hypothetical protein
MGVSLLNTGKIYSDIVDLSDLDIDEGLVGTGCLQKHLQRVLVFPSTLATKFLRVML